MAGKSESELSQILYEAIALIKEMHKNAMYKISEKDDRPTHLPAELFNKVEEFLERNDQE
jgi:hypothetical protein